MKKASENRKALLLTKWLSGDANYQEEKQLRRWAGEDPFFAEALEGYAALPEAGHSDRVEQIKKKLQAKYPVKRKKTAILPGLSIAATVVVVLGAMVWLWYSPNPNALVMEKAPAESHAETAPVAGSEAPGQVKDATVSQESEKLAAAESEASRESKVSAPAARLSKPPASPSEITKPSPLRSEETISLSTPSKLPSAPEKELYENIEAADFAIAEPVAAPAGARDTQHIAEAGRKPAGDAIPDTPAAAAMTPAPGPKKPVVNELRLIVGQVLDPSGEPMIGANVIEDGSPNGTTTDMDGRFELTVKKETSRLQVNYVGYYSQLVPLSQQDSLSIVMNATDVVLDEVHVTGFQRSSKAKRLQPARAEADKAIAPPVVAGEEGDLRPRGGFDKFEKYMLQNIRYPEAAKTNGIKGEVKLQFTIDEKGIPSDFKVLQSLGFGCDEEAIRLLREGPKWKSKSDQVEPTTIVTITF